MKYVCAYAMAQIAGTDKPTAEDVKKILEAGGIEVDDAALATVLKAMDGRDAGELIAAGVPKLEAMGGGGGGGGAAPAAAGGAKEEAKKEEPEEEEEDMDFDLFG